MGERGPSRRMFENSNQPEAALGASDRKFLRWLGVLVAASAITLADGAWLFFRSG